jgi:hypothetical protein
MLTKLVNAANYRLRTQVLIAGERSVLPARSTARTRKVCLPGLIPV